MADMEVEALASFYDSSQAERADFLKMSQGMDLFKGRITEWTWIRNFFTDHGTIPSRRLFLNSFPSIKFPAETDPLSYWAEQLFEREKFNRLKDLMGEVRTDLESLDEDAATKASQKVFEAVASLQQVWEQRRDVNWSDQEAEKWDSYTRLQEELKRDGLTAPWKTLEKLIPRFRPKQLATIIARTSVGKTWMTLVFGLHWWNQGAKVVYISKEMGAEEIAQRADCMNFGLSYTRYTRGTLTAEEERKFKAGIRRLKSGNKPDFIIVDDEDLDETVGVQSVIAKIQEYRPDVVIIDGADLLIGADKAGLAETGVKVARMMKRVAKAKNVFIFQTFQERREGGEQEGGKTGGGLGTVYYADAITHHSDWIFELGGVRKDPVRKFKVEKARNAGLGEFHIRFLFDPPCFDEIPPGEIKPEEKRRTDTVSVQIENEFKKLRGKS